MGLSDCGGDIQQGSVPMTGWKKLSREVKVLGRSAIQRREAAMQDWGHRQCLVLLPGAGSAGGLTCGSNAVAEALSYQVQELREEMSRLNSIGKDEEVTTGSSQ